MRPHSRIDPARADHIPVTEYSSGVTVLLFSATNTSVKSWVTSACSMAPAANRPPTSMTGASSRPSPVAGRTGRVGDPPAGDQPDDGDDDPDEARHEGEPDPDGPQMRVEHQQTGPVDVTLTRFGYWAL